MWIKTENKGLLNLENVNCVYIEERYGKPKEGEKYAVYANDNIIGLFGTLEEAQAYLEKLAAKLEAVKI